MFYIVLLTYKLSKQLLIQFLDHPIPIVWFITNSINLFITSPAYLNKQVPRKKEGSKGNLGFLSHWFAFFVVYFFI